MNGYGGERLRLSATDLTLPASHGGHRGRYDSAPGDAGGGVRSVCLLHNCLAISVGRGTANSINDDAHFFLRETRQNCLVLSRRSRSRRAPRI